MLVDPKTLRKLSQIVTRYSALRYYPIASVSVEMFETMEHFRQEPTSPDISWQNAPAGTKFGGDRMTLWLRGDVVLPSAGNGKKIFIRVNANSESIILIVNGKHIGINNWSHPTAVMDAEGSTGKKYHIACEVYSGTWCPSFSPGEHKAPFEPGSLTFGGVEIMLERDDVSAFCLDLDILLKLLVTLDKESLRYNVVARELNCVYKVIDSLPEETGEDSWRHKLAEARTIMRPLLDSRNSPTTPWFGLIGQCHIDTAWLWPVKETWRKCARSFSCTLSLMEQYPEMYFLQSQPCHAEMMQQEYPGIFARIKEMVTAKRWEPNGALWIEPDCNMPSGESIVRQLLFGIRSTREMFGYTPDIAWLPDTFGYSAALPQLFHEANIPYFCTAKMDWSVDVRMPCDTFNWKGIDGSNVLAHFFKYFTPVNPEVAADCWKNVRHKDVVDRMLIGYGLHDGGGGATMEMLESARRMTDLEGCPKVVHTTASEFMRGIEQDISNLPEWSGELYLPTHQGTLTSIAGIKHGNRKAECAMHNCDFIGAVYACSGKNHPSKKIQTLWKKLLLNQFHDILPGSAIADVNDLAIQQLNECVSESQTLSVEMLKEICGTSTSKPSTILVTNTLGWDRQGEILLHDVAPGVVPDGAGIVSQQIQTLDGKDGLVVSGVTVPAFGSVIMTLGESNISYKSSFSVIGNTIETPFAKVVFDDQGRIALLTDKSTGRNCVKNGGLINAFLMGEDVPESWDNWNIDIDQQLKQKLAGKLIKREIVSNGPLQLRLRSEYALGTASTLIQDMVFHATTPQIDFETAVDWHEIHQLLRVGFDLDVHTDFARHEVQFGHIKRPTHSNYLHDRLRFEVCTHKYTDLSEAGFGVAILNDGKYGIGVQGSYVQLSLLKSGVGPDSRHDEGKHTFTYSLLPHQGGFSVESVVRPAYELNNVPIMVHNAEKSFSSLVTISNPNIIIETIKWAEEGRAFIVRCYEAGETTAQATVKFGVPVKRVMQTNILEEPKQEIGLKGTSINVTLAPFKIVTLRCEVG